MTTTTKSLLARVASFGKSYSAILSSAHALACDVYEHVALTRDTRPLDAFYSVLRVNDQSALRVWIGRIQKETDHSLVSFKAKNDIGQFNVTKADAECEKRIADYMPTVRADRPFFERDVKKEIDLLTDAGFVKRIKSLIAAAKKDGAKVSADLIKSAELLATKAENKVKASATVEAETIAA